MALTKIGSIGINTGIAFAGVTTITTLNGSDAVLSVGGTVNFNSDVSIGGSVSIGGTLTYEDVTNIDSVGLITARNGIVVGSGITLSKDGDGFFTGVVTATSYAGDGSALTNISLNLVDDTSPQLGGNLEVNTKNIVFGDSSDGTSDDVLKFGDGTDLVIYHNGNNSIIDNNTGELRIGGDHIELRNSALNSTRLASTSSGALELYHSNSKKLETTSNGVTVTGTITDSKGDIRSIPQNNTTNAYTLVAADAAKHVLATGTVTIPNSVFSAGDAVTIINNSGSDITLTASVGTLYNTADAATGNRTLAGRGMATIIFSSATVAYISGAGLS